MYLELESDLICHNMSSSSSSITSSTTVEVQTKSFKTITLHTPRKTLLRAHLKAKTQ